MTKLPTEALIRRFDHMGILKRGAALIEVNLLFQPMSCVRCVPLLSHPLAFFKIVNSFLSVLAMSGH